MDFASFYLQQDFFRFEIFMKGHKTAAGAPSGGGGVSFQVVWGRSPH